MYNLLQRTYHKSKLPYFSSKSQYAAKAAQKSEPITKLYMLFQSSLLISHAVLSCFSYMLVLGTKAANSMMLCAKISIYLCHENIIIC